MSRHYVVGVIQKGNEFVVLEDRESKNLSFPECDIQLGEAFGVATTRNFYNMLGLEVQEIDELGRQELKREDDDVCLYFTHLACMNGRLDPGQLNSGEYRWADADEILGAMDMKKSVNVPLETKRFLEGNAIEKPRLPAGIDHDMAFA